MKYLLSIVVLALFGFSAEAASNGRPAMSNRVISAPRYIASAKQLNGMGNALKTSVGNANTEQKVEETVEEPIVEKPAEEVVVIDMREAERNACISNNIGLNNTFVWASRYSDTSNYANMVEDVEHPEDNVCFVRVDLNSTNESRITVADIAPKYFMWNETIECGSWVDKKEMEKRILDARKGARIGGIVASTVGGMGLGVGAMELFGNRLIGGKVEGQKGVDEKTLYKERLKSMNDSERAEYKEALRILYEACNDSSVVLSDCSTYKDLYNAIKD